ncbi:hypothetical protein, partial [Thiolapillus sp.]|uniref:hypothetical protein n=1 Tax=Thiolapillus sp. TaxID=2017437 RepID=UPI0025E27AAC
MGQKNRLLGLPRKQVLNGIVRTKEVENTHTGVTEHPVHESIKNSLIHSLRHTLVQTDKPIRDSA